MSQPPIRMIDDRETRAGLARGLREAARPTGQYDVDRGILRLQAALGAERMERETSIFGKDARAGIVAIAVLSAIAGIALGRRSHESTSSPLPSSAALAVATPLAPLSTSSLPEADAVSPHMLPEAPSALPSPRPSATAASPGRAAARAIAPENAGDVLEETRHLVALRRAAATDPARCVSLAAEGARRFPHGSFAEEREALALVCAAAGGRGEATKARAEKFVRAYPDSPFIEHVRRAADL